MLEKRCIPCHVKHGKRTVKFMQLNRNIILALAVGGAVILWLITGLFGGDDSPEAHMTEDNTSLKPVKVVSQSFTPTAYVQTIQSVGRTEPDTFATVAAQTAGNIIKVNVSRGDVVEKGAPLVTIDQASRKAAVNAAQADFNATQAEYNVAHELNREGLLSNTTLAVRNAALTAAQQRLELAQEDLAYTTVKAPIIGRVEDKFVDVGDYVNVGTNLLTLLKRDVYLLVAYVAQADQARVAVGQIASATLANGQEIEGRVRFVAQHANLETKTYRVDIEVDGNDYALPLGMTADINIPVADVQAIKVPHSALVLNDEGELGVMTISANNTAAFMPTEILQDTADGIWVKTAASANAVIIRGQGGLSVGTPVKNETIPPHAE